jgi:hypothetical protein
MIRRRAVVPAVVLGVVSLVGCTSNAPPAALSQPSSATASPSPSATASVTPTPVPTPTPTDPRLPDVRWDKVPRGPLPAECATVGSVRVFVVRGGVYAKGPSLSCRAGGYHVRALVKVAAYHGHGHWSYVTEAHPSAAHVDRASEQRSEVVLCPSGHLVRAVASFVLTDSHGHQVRYRRIGTTARCP